MRWCGVLAVTAIVLASSSLAGEGADVLKRNLYGGTMDAGIAELEPLAAAGDAEAKFGIGILQVLLTAPGGLVDQVPKDVANLARRLRNLLTPDVERTGVEPAGVARAEVERAGTEPVEPPA